MRKKRMIVAMLSMILIVLSVGQVIVSNGLSTTGITLASIDKDIHAYELQNALLQEKILTESSLTEVASKAATLGFSEGKSQLVVSGLLPVAIKP